MSLKLSDIAKSASESVARLEKDMLAAKKKTPKKKPKDELNLGVDEPSHRPIDMTVKNIDDEFAKLQDDRLSKAFIGYVSNDMKLSPDETKKLMVGFQDFKQNISYQSIIMKCPGDEADDKGKHKCPHFDMCPFREIEKYPENKMCPIERLIADNEIKEYLRILNIQSIEDGRLPIALINTVFSLVDCDLSEIRMRNLLQKDGYTRMRKIFGMQGQMVTEEEDISKVFEIKERVSRRKDTLMKSLMLTPEIKAKLKVEDEKDKVMSPADALVLAREKLEMKRLGTEPKSNDK